MTPQTQRALELFASINRIPRCSGKERAISDWIVGWADERGLVCERDELLNILIRVPGTRDRGDAKPVAIQGHMDMVCEKTPESSHDFDRDSIEMVTAGDWLSAKETTLGADNGIAIAIALAFAESQEVAHPPLELLFTVDEETGLTGAQGLNPAWLKSRTLINIDSEDEGVITIGCAGGLNSVISVPVETEPIPKQWELRSLTVSGLQGGHSGVDIHLDRANANVLAVRVIADLQRKLAARIIGIHGGSAHNAIPRDCRITFAVDPKHGPGTQEAGARWLNLLTREYETTDPGLAITVSDPESADGEVRVLTEASSISVARVLQSLPNGVQRMEREIPELVETSTNLATIRTTKDNITIDTSQRSSSESQLEAIAAKVAAVAALGGGSVTVKSRYPAWEPQRESQLLATAGDCYRETFGQDPVVEVIHAGLECGVIGAKIEGMEMISIGPTIEMPHSPDERINIPSLDRLVVYLTRLLDAI